MRKILAITSVFIKAMIRSWLFIILAFILIGITAGLPFIIKSDGTAVGWARIIIYYNLGATAIVLSIVSLWAGCGAISREITEKQLQMVLCKPVSVYQVWLGKWLGLLFLNLVMLAITGALTYALLSFSFTQVATCKPGENPFKTVMTGRRIISPEAPAIEDEVARRLKEVLANTNQNSEISAAELSDEIRKTIIGEKCVIPAGQSREWTINIPSSSRPMKQQAPGAIPAVSLRYLFRPAMHDLEAAEYKWSILSVDKRLLFEKTMSTFQEGEKLIPLPDDMLVAGSSVTVVFSNSTHSTSRTVVLDPDQGIQILVRESAFPSNLARGLLIMFCQLALLSALGLAASSMMSFPVASFAAVAIILMTITSNFLSSGDNPGSIHYDHEGNPVTNTMLENAGEKMGMLINIVGAPVLKTDPVNMLSQGILVSWEMTGLTALLLLVIYPAVLLLISGAVLRRRQLALPGQ